MKQEKIETKAILRPVAFEITCPHCDQVMENNRGSQMWLREELGPGEDIKCSCCGNFVEVPEYN